MRFERAMKNHSDEFRRHERRSNQISKKIEYPRPDSWSLRADFNPYLVKSRADVYGHAIQKALQNDTYEVKPPAIMSVPKAGGGYRQVVSFGIPDEAVSRITYNSLMNKNRAVLSGRSYAYRNDLNVFDAIDYISREWRENSRLYIAEYDLRDYFGSVDHFYINRTISDLSLHMTPREERVVAAFMTAPRPLRDVGHGPAQDRFRGIPQGTSVSLFLANVALTPLDRRLERLGIGFARFSDDLLIWSPNYESVRTAVDLLLSWSEDAGVDLSYEKSPGIRIISRAAMSISEMNAVTSVDFLSHSLSLRSVGVGSKPLSALKTRVSELIYANLLREPLRGSQNLSRLDGGTDRDYVTLASQLRRLLYGSLSERQVRRLATSGYIPRLHFTGKVANHPTISNVDDWRAFDIWLRRKVWLALRRREKLLRSQGYDRDCIPWGCSPNQLATVQVKSTHGDIMVDARIPTATLMATVVSRSTSMHGNRIFERPRGVY